MNIASRFCGARAPQPIFELSALNVEKGLIDKDTLLSRMTQAFPYPVVATRAPKFVDKASLFPGAVFVIGYDTMVRLVDPKFYGDDRDAMVTALLTIRDSGCSFIVGGRIDADGIFETYEASSAVAKAPAGIATRAVPRSLRKCVPTRHLVHSNTKKEARRGFKNIIVFTKSSLYKISDH